MKEIKNIEKPLLTSSKGWDKKREQSHLAENAMKSLYRFVGRQNISARSNALGLNEIMNSIAPRLTIVQDYEFAWGKTTCPAIPNRLTHLEENEKNRSLFSQNIKNGSLEEINLKRGLRLNRNPRRVEKNRSISTADVSLKRYAEIVSASYATGTVAFGKRFLTTFGITATCKATRIAVQNRLKHLNETEIPFFFLCFPLLGEIPKGKGATIFT